MTKIMEFIRDHKGAISSCLGFILAFPMNAHFVYTYYSNIKLEEHQLTTIVIANVIATIWYIMPSRIEISGKIINLKIED